MPSVGPWQLTLPHSARAPGARSPVAAEPGLLSAGETLQGLLWGWGLGSSWAGGHVVQPTLHVYSRAPREVQGERGNLWEAVDSDAFLSPWLTRLVQSGLGTYCHLSLCNKCQLCVSIHLLLRFKMLKIRQFSLKNVTTQLPVEKSCKNALEVISVQASH